jgi:ribosomal protein S12 methylthiotransferase accessory factor
MWETLSSLEPNCSFHDLPNLATDSFNEDLKVLVDALARIGIDEIAVVNLTRPDFGIPVVKVVVPGLEGDPDHCIPGARVTARLEATA